MPESPKMSRKAIVCFAATAFVLLANLIGWFVFCIPKAIVPGWLASLVFFILLIGLFLGLIGLDEIDHSEGRLRGRKLIEWSCVLTVVLFAFGCWVAPIFFFLRDAAERNRQMDLNDQLYPVPKQGISK
jgi:hypothetical protein